MTCGRGEPLWFHHFSSFLVQFSFTCLSVSSSSNRTHFIRSGQVYMCTHHSLHCQWALLSAFACLCVVEYILCIVDNESKYKPGWRRYVVCLLTNNGWIGHHVFSRHFIQAENRLLFCSFCCGNADAAALITSDSDNKNRLPEKTFWRPLLASAQKGRGMSQMEEQIDCFPPYFFANALGCRRLIVDVGIRVTVIDESCLISAFIAGTF